MESRPGGGSLSQGIYYQDFLSGFTIALISHSLDPSLSVQLIARYPLG